MIREYLQMIFKNEEGRNFTVSVYDPKEDITMADVEGVMDDVLVKNIFHSPGGELTGKVAARIVTREVNSIAEF